MEFHGGVPSVDLFAYSLSRGWEVVDGESERKMTTVAVQVSDF